MHKWVYLLLRLMIAHQQQDNMSHHLSSLTGEGYSDEMCEHRPGSLYKHVSNFYVMEEEKESTPKI